MLSKVKIPELLQWTVKAVATRLREVGMLDTQWLEGQEDIPWTKVMKNVLVRATPASLKVQGDSVL